jgi:hypothetical protein
MPQETTILTEPITAISGLVEVKFSNFQKHSAALIVRCNINLFFFSFPKCPQQPKGGKEYLYATENFILA